FKNIQIYSVGDEIRLRQPSHFVPVLLIVNDHRIRIAQKRRETGTATRPARIAGSDQFRTPAKLAQRLLYGRHPRAWKHEQQIRWHITESGGWITIPTQAGN